MEIPESRGSSPAGSLRMGSGGSPSRTPGKRTSQPAVELRDSADVCPERGTCEGVKSDKERERRIKLLPQDDEQHNKKPAANITNHHTWLAVGSSTIQCAVCVVNKLSVLRHPNRFKNTFHPTSCSISKQIRHFNKTILLKHNQTSPRPSLASETSVLHGHQNVKYCTFLIPTSLSLPRSH